MDGFGRIQSVDWSGVGEAWHCPSLGRDGSSTDARLSAVEPVLPVCDRLFRVIAGIDGL